MLPLIEKAVAFAEKAHAGQVRKVTNVPYIVHPKRVAEMVAPFVSPAAIAAAYLHDVIEDTDHKDLSQFPLRVRRLVHLLTKIPGDKIGSINKLSFDTEGMLIKVADRIDNIEDGAISLGKSWAKMYLVTSRYILDSARAMGLESHPIVTRLAASIEYLSSVAAGLEGSVHANARKSS